MKKVERLISIVMILLQKEVVSASEFSRLFHVTKRTIQRDMEPLGFANKRLLKHKDIENILVALGGFEQLIKDQEIQATIQKIKGMTGEDISPKLDQTSFNILIYCKRFRPQSVSFSN
ncbi:hypothetical protein GCM10009001_16650 [Virgibacillus siamensis]|uniref:Helix-turn-helix type 11 domain-containing protein n=1 Tax=Virgibacillus siamensis TaxID=480071 RepID=A0ABN1FZ54_9BACI